MTLPMEDTASPQAAGSLALAALRGGSGDGSLLGHLDAGLAPKSNSRILRIEVNGSLHDWFDIEEMGDFVRSPTFADTLLENIARYFGVQVENQAIYDEDGLLTTSADFSRALQRVAPMLYIYDITDMGPELKERTVEELATINAGVEQSWNNFRMLSKWGSQKGEGQETSEAEKPPPPASDGLPSLPAAGQLGDDSAADDVLLSAETALPSSTPPSDAGKQLAWQIGSSGPSAIKLTDPGGYVSQLGNTFGSALPYTREEVVSARLSDPKTSQPPPAGHMQAVYPYMGGSTSAETGTSTVSQQSQMSAQSSVRTVFSTAARNEELLAGARSGRSANVRPGIASPARGSQVRRDVRAVSPIHSGHAVPLQQHQQVRQAQAPSRAGASLVLGNATSMSWPPVSSASAPAAPWSNSAAPWSNSVPSGNSEDLGSGRMMQGNALLGPSGSLEIQRPLSPKRPYAGSGTSVSTPPQTAKSLGSEARSVTPVSQARLLNGARPPPISPAHLNAQNAGLMRMASNPQCPWSSLRSMERSVSPCRSAVTPPMGGRSLTPTSSARQVGAEPHAQVLRQAQTMPNVRASLPGSGYPPGAAVRGSTPVRSMRGQSGNYAAPAPGQVAPGQIAFGPGQPGLGFNQDGSSFSGFSNSWLSQGGSEHGFRR